VSCPGLGTYLIVATMTKHPLHGFGEPFRRILSAWPPRSYQTLNAWFIRSHAMS
jgi:hypothetical protein